MDRRATIWLGFAVVAAHNVEEYLTMGGFLAAHREDLPTVFSAMTGEHFTVSLALVTLLALLVTWGAARSRPKGPWLVLAAAFQGGMAVNALQHAGIAAWRGGYAPGVVTGLALCLPYGVHFVRRSLREGWVGPRPLLLTTAVLLLLAMPFLMALHSLSLWIL